ncbi:MAG: hypothetical protein M3Q10_07160, partial [Chloroflexota bacterium]|nr:hypothetical protein [Chloroflexota bacterium]
WRLTALHAEVLDLAEAARSRPLFRTRAELGYVIDPAAPEGFAAALRDALRSVLAGETTPAAAATALELAWEAEREE